MCHLDFHGCFFLAKIHLVDTYRRQEAILAGPGAGLERRWDAVEMTFTAKDFTLRLQFVAVAVLFCCFCFVDG